MLFIIYFIKYKLFMHDLNFLSWVLFCGLKFSLVYEKYKRCVALWRIGGKLVPKL